MADFPAVQEGEVVTPVMDDYGMKCCDCDLIHTFRFRAIRVTEHLPDGTFQYEELDPAEYRVQLMGSRPERQPPWPKRNGRPGQPMCNGCPGPGSRPSWRNLWKRCCGLATADVTEERHLAPTGQRCMVSDVQRSVGIFTVVTINAEDVLDALTPGAEVLVIPAAVSLPQEKT